MKQAKFTADDFLDLIEANPHMVEHFIAMAKALAAIGKPLPLSAVPVLYETRKRHGWTCLNAAAPFFSREYLRRYPDETNVTFKLKPSAADLPPTRARRQMSLFAQSA